MRLIIVGIVLSLLLGALGYISSGSYIAAGVVGLVFCLYGIFYVKRKIENCIASAKRAHECQQFVNNFLLSMSVRNSLSDAFESATIGATSSFQNELNHIEHLSIRERIDYLNKYFRFDVYYVFLNILTLFEDQGGNILLMSETLIQEINRIEEAMINAQSLINRKIVEFIMLWLITLGIIVFMRFGLGQFYTEMLNGTILFIMTASLFGLLLLSVHIALDKFTTLPIGEGNHHATL
ncbi:MAG: hypothetical protein WC344_03395 [Bacilli bacterium]|jgi:hypothetical protein